MSRKHFHSGDPVPWFNCPSSNRARFQFDSLAGRYVVLSFFGSTGCTEGAQAVSFVYGRLRHFFDDNSVCYFGVSTDPADQAMKRIIQMIPGIRFFWDFDRHVSALFGALPATDNATYRPFTLVLDPSLRVLADIPLDDIEDHNQQLEQILLMLPAAELHAETELSAPVLIVPRVLERPLCDELISFYEAHGGDDSGFMREQDGKTIGMIDHSVKRRADCQIDDEFLRTAIRSRIKKRLVPEIRRAFQFNATHIERYIVACYEGEHSGFFRPHRDNTTKGTAHRRFACTINLNCEEYEGGDLRFPEFGTRTYRAPTGGAVVFSCSLLHEAMPVTKGRRYATLPFLYDVAAAKIRAENRRYLSGEVITLDPAAVKSGASANSRSQGQPPPGS